jgi:hypothetical protein
MRNEIYNLSIELFCIVSRFKEGNEIEDFVLSMG